MTLIPSVRHTTAVFLFGREACEKGGEILAYLAKALPEHVWSNLLFVRVFRGDALPAYKERPARLLGFDQRCDQAVDAGQLQLSRAIIDKLSEMMNSGLPLQLHCITGFGASSDGAPADGDLPPEYPVRFARAVAAQFPAASPNAFFYTALQYGEEACAQQRAFAQALQMPFPNGHAIPFFLTPYLPNGAKVSRFDVWRSISCLLLTNMMDSFQGIAPGHLYSVGYKGINAGDSELTELLSLTVKGRLDDLRQAPITASDAWKLLMDDESVMVDTEMASQDQQRDRVMNWLCGLASAYLPDPTPDELENLRILCRVEDTGSIDHALCSFYSSNFIVPADRDERCPGLHAQQTIVEDVSRHLSTTCLSLPNLEMFPHEELNSFLKTMEEITRSRVAPLTARDFPKAPLFPWQKNKYLLDCLMQRSGEVRRHYLQLFCKHLSKQLLPCYQQLEKAVVEVQRQHELQKALLFNQTHTADLREKYAPYWQQLQYALNKQTHVFGNVWDDGTASTLDKARQSHQLYLMDGQLNRDVCAQVLDIAQERVRNGLPVAYRGSFINVISAMNGGVDSMNTFLSNYLPEPQVMFNAIGEIIPHNMDTIYFADSGLGQNAWFVAGKGDHTIFTIQNDNVELLNIFDLNTTLDRLLDENRYIINNPFYHRQAGVGDMGGVVFSDGYGGQWDTRIRFDEEFYAPIVGEEEAAAQEPLITCQRKGAGNALVLKWLWPEGVENMTYQINNATAVSLTRGGYGVGITLQMGDKSVLYGRNDITVSYKVGGVPYGQISVPGFMQKVTASAADSELRVMLPPPEAPGRYYHGPAEKSEIWESSLAFQLALYVPRKPRNPRVAPSLLYPVCLEQQHGAHQEMEVIFRGLKLGGRGAKLIHSPIYRYPTLQP